MKNHIKQPTFSSHDCIACWKCVEACPRHAIRKVSFLWHRHAVMSRSSCIGCGRCVKTCPQGCFKSNS